MRLGYPMPPHTSTVSQTRLPSSLHPPAHHNVTWDWCTGREEVMLHVMCLVTPCDTSYIIWNISNPSNTDTDRYLHASTIFSGSSLWSAAAFLDWIHIIAYVLFSYALDVAMQPLCSSISRPCSPTHKRHHKNAIASSWIAPRLISFSSKA